MRFTWFSYDCLQSVASFKAIFMLFVKNMLLIIRGINPNGLDAVITHQLPIFHLPFSIARHRLKKEIRFHSLIHSRFNMLSTCRLMNDI